MMEIRVVLYLLNGKYHLAFVIPHIIGYVPIKHMLIARTVTLSSKVEQDRRILADVEKKFREFATEDAKMRRIKNPFIWGLDKDCS